MIARVLTKTGATVRERGMMYKAVAQSVFLCGSKSWVVMGDILKVLEVFHHRAVRRITGMTAKRGVGGKWEYPPVVADMDATRLHKIREYIRRLQENISEKVA